MIGWIASCGCEHPFYEQNTEPHLLAGPIGRDSCGHCGGPTSQAHCGLGQPQPACHGSGDPGHACEREDPAWVRTARDSRVTGDQRDDQPGDAPPARHPARRSEAAWASRTKHAHRAGDWDRRRPGLWGWRGCKVAFRQDVSGFGQGGVHTAGSDCRHGGRGGSAYRWMARRISSAMRPGVG